MSHTVRLSTQPVDLINVDFQIAKPDPTDVPTPPVLPLKPQASAQQHNLRGRQLNKTGRYRDAIVELTKAIRMAPDFALAFNARGFSLVMLHEWAQAIEDLNKAIVLNPSYGNAYFLRSIARKTIGDATGAKADLMRCQQLAN